MKVALALVLVASAAYADDKDEDVAFATALAKPDAKYLAGALAVPFHAKGLPFRTIACKQAFGGDKTISDAKQLPKLATCLGELVLADPKAKTPPIVDKMMDSVAGDTCTSNLIVGDYEMWIALQVGNHPYKVTGVRAELLDGVIGGVRGTLPAMCTTKATPTPPKNIAPQALEKNRKGGTKEIFPSDATKKEIENSGRSKVVGSWKLCIDETGAVDAVRVLKATGFPSYDATIEATLKTWSYKPFLVDDVATPVCTAVTFIYSR